MERETTTERADRPEPRVAAPVLPRDRQERRAAADGGGRSSETAHADPLAELGRLVLRPQETEIAVAVRPCLQRERPRGRDDRREARQVEEAIAALVDYWLSGIEAGGEAKRTTPIPAAIGAWAGAAAWAGIELGAVVEGWIAARRVLRDLALVAAGDQMTGPLPIRLLTAEDQLAERLVAGIITAYMAEYERVTRSGQARRDALITRLLLGEVPDASALATINYDFDRWHVGLLAWGSDAQKAMQTVAGRLGRDLLVGATHDQPLSAWLGGHEILRREDLERVFGADEHWDLSLAVGEAARGFDGWRLTHEEARAALPVALQRPQRITHCADVLLDAAVLQSAAIAACLSGRFLTPLDRLRIGGALARQTLTAYFACDRSVSSTASLLEVTRKTVERRLKQIEDAVGRPVRGCLELEVALRLEAISRSGNDSATELGG